jgi:hypothetical protein
MAEVYVTEKIFTPSRKAAKIFLLRLGDLAPLRDTSS